MTYIAPSAGAQDKDQIPRPETMAAPITGTGSSLFQPTGFRTEHRTDDKVGRYHPSRARSDNPRTVETMSHDHPLVETLLSSPL
ncbi:hypothetical protein POX_h09815 [Penicillium oxalicum]|uniref:Uncharacterized protein n=1 Tax=Penicillium oxalicum (strain 114-2 / CGMCC 5302) TaxID=933388 RepID=S7ZS49_PENO1|nr:hypothetical protein POX_h09815 [Penicillium oxalicum]EPS31536.1 hypothetical protein PDE_06491 [Penicillium oxalicum 114-2]KAI2786050.1 hypothetical protein POX_h09815 [Penicillium oxalicum]